MSQIKKSGKSERSHSAAQLQEENTKENCGTNCFSDNRETSAVSTISDNRTPIQRITRIRHASIDFDYGTATDKVGSQMEAYLDPLDPVQGSATGTPQKALYDAVKVAATASMVRGHLLNHDLGGYGVAENLYPITSSANSKHKNYVENPVQKELKAAYTYSNSGGRHDSNTGTGVYYKVTVGNIKNNTADLVNNKVSFICEAKKTTDVGKDNRGNQGATMFSTTVESDAKGASSDERGRAFRTGTEDGNPVMKDSQKVITPGWNHFSRSGKRDFLDRVEDGKITLGAESDQTPETSQDLINGANSVLEETYAAHDEYSTVLQEMMHGHSALRVHPITYLAMSFIPYKYEQLRLKVANVNLGGDVEDVLRRMASMKEYAEQLRDDLYNLTDYLYEKAIRVP